MYSDSSAIKKWKTSRVDFSSVEQWDFVYSLMCKVIQVQSKKCVPIYSVGCDELCNKSKGQIIL